MKFTFATLALALLSVSPAAAQSAWDGFYVGGMTGSVSGTSDYADEGKFDGYNVTGSASGAFAGYNRSVGKVVLGFETAGATSGAYEVDASDGTLYEDYYYDNIVDAKFRVGVEKGKLLVFGLLGYSTADYYSGDTGVFAASGPIIGAGVDYMISDKFFVGGEIASRLYEFTDTDQGDIATNLNTISLRAGFRF